MAEEEGAMTLELTPTWVVAVVCTVIIAISLGVERLLHLGGEFLKKKNQKPLFEALQKVKEELMLLGFISLLLTVFQGFISKICIPSKYVRHMLPCRFPEKEGSSASTTEHTGIFRRLLSEGGGAQEAYCAAKHKVPFLSVEALHHLHIFIFVLAIVHVTFCVLTVLFGGAKIRQWKHWEDAIRKENNEAEAAFQPKITHVHQHAFIRDRFIGIGERSVILNWIVSLTFLLFSLRGTAVSFMNIGLPYVLTSYFIIAPKYHEHIHVPLCSALFILWHSDCSSFFIFAAATSTTTVTLIFCTPTILVSTNTITIAGAGATTSNFYLLQNIKNAWRQHGWY